jgi:hypothetical protein
MTRAKWIRRQLITYGVFLLAVNATAGWARLLMGDEMHEPWFLSLAKPFMAALFLWWGVTRLIEDINIKVVEKAAKEPK